MAAAIAFTPGSASRPPRARPIERSTQPSNRRGAAAPRCSEQLTPRAQARMNAAISSSVKERVIACPPSQMSAPSGKRRHLPRGR
jgi:hypothetical protein